MTPLGPWTTAVLGFLRNPKRHLGQGLRNRTDLGDEFHSECRYCPNWAATDTPGSPVRPCHMPAGYSRTALSAHSLTIAYSQMCLGFHCTAVVRVRAFTILLFYSYLNYTQTGLPMELSNYPPNTITKHLYIELNNTFY